MLNEFKKFAFKGNVIDMAVGVMIGAAFGSIVTSLVNDIFMPVIGLLIGTENLNQLFIILSYPEVLPEGTTVEAIRAMSLADAKAVGATVLSYGSFISAILNFFIIAIIVFFIVRLIKKASTIGKKKEEPEAAKELRKCPYCKQVIDDEATRCPHCTSDLDID